ncbi:MAG: OmpA family protein [Deltaproteobacteria bacterium]|jgi:chemotaxis protein MotB|nr:OmpA family protein [Deltaproteobacteria bacterium]
MSKLAIFIKSSRYIICLFSFLSLILSGCVTTSKYQALQTKYDSLNTLHISVNQEKNELQEVNRQLDAEVDELKNNSIQLTGQCESQIQASQTMINNLTEEADTKTTQINLLKEALKVNLVEKIMFESGSANVTKEGRETLARIAPILKEAKDKEIHIVGHCDRLPPCAELSKKYPTNWELSTARAIAVMRILQWGFDIDPHRMVAVGVGHYRPLDMEIEKKISEKNRAVEIFLATPNKGS